MGRGLLLLLIGLLAGVACSGTDSTPLLDRAALATVVPSTPQPSDDAVASRRRTPTPAAAGSTPVAGTAGQAVAKDGVRVAFFGDQGLGPNAIGVLDLIKREGADLVIHLGDFDYDDNPAAWEAQINAVLGPSFPYFASIGNHDEKRWSVYQQLLLARLQKIEGASCSGDYGVNAACTYKGLFFILSGAGTMGSGHAQYILQQLAANNATWSICAWHKNMTAMQVGGKDNDAGWDVYEACRAGGGIVATSHEHSYSRTKTLSSIQDQTIDPAWPDPRQLRVGGGSTFVFVSGLGGQSIRDQERCRPTTPPYGCKQEWASIYTEQQGARPGALFIDFGVDGDPRKARGYFKNVNGEVIDTFTIVAQ